MAVTSDLDHERASDEAAAWLIRLQEEPDDRTVRARFEAWRRAAPAHAAAWSEIAQTFDLIGDALPAIDAAPVAVSPAKRLGRASPRRLFSVAAAVALAACVALVFLPGVMLRLEADHATATGEWRELRLTDGSVVDLAPRSAIEVAMAGDRRRVRLTAGQAFFQVTPDAARPFQVEARDVRATVLGTSFDVRLERGGAGVAVSEGRVRVDVGASSKVLQANDWLTADATGRLRSGKAPDGEIGAWRQGQLVAHDRPIAEIVDELRPWFGGMIVVASEATGKRRVTGVYTLRDPLEALRAVGRAHDGIAVTHVLPWLLVVSGG